MVADPEQMRFYPRSKSRDEVGVWLAWNLAFYEERGFGTWYLEPVFDSAFAGYCGLRPLLLAGRQEVELACHVKKAFWNRGFATEAALRSMQLGFDQFACRVSWRSSTPTTSPRGASRRSSVRRRSGASSTMANRSSPTASGRD